MAYDTHKLLLSTGRTAMCTELVLLLLGRYNGEQADIWRTGVMLYAMLLGRYPFDSNMPDQLRLRVMTERPLEGTEGLSAECQELLEGMLHPNQ
jgi:serine/threonine protein kinase